MRNGTIANPVQQLRDNAKRLEAALTVGLADPTSKAVHELRSSTRRVEAQLNLLALVHGLPTWKPAADKLQRRLNKLRRAAGRVRDCDVQTKLLEDKDHVLASAVEAPADISKTQDKLTRRLDKARKREEKKLLAEVDRQLPKLARDTEKLLKALKPAEDHEVPVGELLNGIGHEIGRLLQSREHGEDHLHEIRKVAKRARYQCESMPGPQAAAMAKRLEQLQDAGGSWHDHLDLATTCHNEFGPEHALSRVIEHIRDEHLDRYLANLDDFRSTHRDGATGHAASKRKPPHKAATSSRVAAKSKRARSA